jgi:hypothetical protein
MNRWLIAVALLVCWSGTAAAKTACLSSHGSDAYYQYRIIDHRKCWYAGAERLEKSALAWKLNSGSEKTSRLSVRAKAPAARLQGPPEQQRNTLGVTAGETAPDFDATFAYFPAYEIARPVVQLLYPKNVAQAWGSKRVAVVLYRREP